MRIRILSVLVFSILILVPTFGDSFAHESDDESEPSGLEKLQNKYGVPIQAIVKLEGNLLTIIAPFGILGSHDRTQEYEVRGYVVQGDGLSISDVLLFKSEKKTGLPVRITLDTTNILIPDDDTKDVRVLLEVHDIPKELSLGGVIPSNRIDVIFPSHISTVTLPPVSSITAISEISVDINNNQNIEKAVVTFDTSQIIEYIIQSYISATAAVAGVDNTLTFEQASEIDGTFIKFIPGAVNIDIVGDTGILCPCEVSLTYVDTVGIPEGTIHMYHFDEITKVWEMLPTVFHDTVNNVLTATTDSFSPFALGTTSVQSSTADGTINKNGGGYSEWKTKQTFGMSWEIPSAQLVEDGFTFNGHTLDITDNWHTDFTKTSSIIGDENNVQIKAYAPNGFKSVTLSLGVPEIGDLSNAETDIIIMLNRNYTSIVDYTITEIIHEQKEPLVNVNSTTVTVTPSLCNDSHVRPTCYTFDINFTIDAPLTSDVLAISAVDTNRRITTTYINEGVEFTGESLLPPATSELFQKKTNQSPGEYLELTQQDRRYNIWEDQYGYIWSQNDHGSWIQITTPSMQRHIDSSNTVMTRVHSDFVNLVQHEQDRAVLIFDGSKLKSSLGDSFAYEFDDSTADMPKPVLLFDQLHIEEKKAQAIIDIMFQKYLKPITVEKYSGTTSEIQKEFLDLKEKAIIDDVSLVDIKHKNNMIFVSGTVGKIVPNEDIVVTVHYATSVSSFNISVNNNGSFEMNKIVDSSLLFVTVEYDSNIIGKYR